MQLYECTVRLGGSVMNEVRKEEVTAPEMLLLRAIHGEDAVVNVTPTRMDKARDDSDERERLFRLYCDTAHPESEVPSHFSRLFGAEYQPLPQHVPGITAKKRAAPAAAMDLG